MAPQYRKIRIARIDMDAGEIPLHVQTKIATGYAMDTRIT